MKTERKKMSGRKKYIVYGTIYIAFCFVTLFVCAVTMNTLIQRNSINQMKETIGLIAEKVNLSFDMMSSYVEQEACILSVQEDLDLEAEYAMLQQLRDGVDYQSIGIVTTQGELYCSPGEMTDLTKYGYDQAALAREGVFITEPYLSCVTGTNVITMFAPIYQDEQIVGDLFVTYQLEYVQELAKTTVLKHDVESYLMNALSGNYITCSNSVNHTAGVWGNLSMIKNDMHCTDGYDYNVWMRHMAEKSEDNVLCYEMDGVDYTQAFVDITSMEDWFVVVRIPNIELNNTMHQYLWCMGICAGVLVLVTLALALLIYDNESRQKEKMQAISEIDPLTGLMNRRAFNLRLEEQQRKPGGLADSAYIFIDIDFFKEVNDNYGHAVGDEILQNVSAIMKTIFVNNGLVARVGGDEFNILCYDHAHAEEMIRDYCDEIKKIRLADGTDFPIGCSIGMARFEKDDTLETLTAHADEALYYVKRNGKGHYKWYHEFPKDELPAE